VTYTQGEGDVKMEVEIGVMKAQTKEWQQSLEAGS
jgi:hypothetical protein